MCTSPRIGSCSRRRRSSRAWRAAPPFNGGGAASASAPASTPADGADAYQGAGPCGLSATGAANIPSRFRSSAVSTDTTVPLLVSTS